MQWIDGTHFVDALLRRGYDILGKGAYSTVLARRDCNRVIKVNRVLDDWLDYVVWAARNGYAGKSAPKIYSYRRLKGSSHDFYVAVVERFESTASELYDAKPRLVNLSYKLGGYIKGYVSEVELSTLECPPEMVRFARDFGEAFHGAGFDIHSGNWIQQRMRLRSVRLKVSAIRPCCMATTRSAIRGTSTSATVSCV